MRKGRSEDPIVCLHGLGGDHLIGADDASLEESDDFDGDPFVPNDFAEDDSFQASEVIFLF